MVRVGIRELRQNLSVHLRRVKEGEVLEVTERGRPVAMLTPLPEAGGARERLIEAGKLRPASAAIADLPQPVRVEAGVSDPASRALAEEREERI